MPNSRSSGNQIQLAHYGYFKEHYTPKESGYVGWSSSANQYQRLRLILSLLPVKGLASSSILDVGCGLGPLLNILPLGIRYTGIDICPWLIKEAIGLHPNPHHTFQLKDIRQMTGSYDYVVCSGALNLRIHNSMMAYAIDMVEAMAKCSTRAVIVNMLSSESQEKAEGHYYYEPGRLLTKLLQCWGRVAIRHDYSTNDFTVFIDTQK